MIARRSFLTGLASLIAVTGAFAQGSGAQLPAGSILSIVSSAAAPEGYSFGGTSLPCGDYPDLCKALSPYYVKDGIVTLPECPRRPMVSDEDRNKSCIIRIR